jgi:hypothetical protein
VRPWNNSAGLKVPDCVEGVGKREESLDSFLVDYVFLWDEKLMYDDVNVLA